MKILIVADHIDPIVYSAGIKERFGDVDLILGAGDLPLDYYDFIAASLNKPLVFVFGNHNLKHLGVFRKTADLFEQAGPDPWALSRLPGGLYADRKVVKIKGLLIAGLGGSRWYNGGGNQFRERQMFRRALSLVPRLIWNKLRTGRYLDILLTHASPSGIHDRPDTAHQGFEAFLWLMRRYRPRYLIHGHVHLYNRNEERTSRYHETTVVNAYDHVVVDLEGDSVG